MITAEDLEKMAELKEKGIISEEEFNAKKNEFLSLDKPVSNKGLKMLGNKKYGKVLLIALIVLTALFIGSRLIYSISGGISRSNNGKEGFFISISCKLNGHPLPLHACTANRREVILKTGTNRMSYNGYNIPSSYQVPQHFDFFIYNGSEDYTIEMKIVDKATQAVVSRRQVGPYSGDRIGN